MMRNYRNIVGKEILNNKKRSLLTLLGIIFGVALMIFLGEVDYLNYRYKLAEEEMAWGKAHAEFYNIDFDTVIKLKNNSLLDSVGISKWIPIENEESDYFMIGDTDYFENILRKDFYEIEGRFPISEDEISLGNKYKDKYKVGDRIKVQGRERRIVGSIVHKNLEYGQGLIGYIGIDDLKSTDKLNVLVKLKKEKNMMATITEIGDELGIEISNIVGEDETFSVAGPKINLLGEDVEYGGSFYPAKKSNNILQIIIVIALILLTYITINTSVKEKRKSYATLKCLGANNGQIRSLIIKEGILFAIFSIVPGVILGEIIFFITEGKLLGVINKIGFRLPYEFNIKTVLTTIIIVIFICIIASLMSMVGMSKLAPIEGIKGNTVRRKKRRVRSRFIRKSFGYEAELAYKNLVSDKANFIGITLTMIISLIIFNVFTSYYEFSLKQIKEKSGVMERDIKVNDSNENKGIKEFLKKYDNVGEISSVREFNRLVRIEGLDDEVIKDSLNYRVFDEKTGEIVTKNFFMNIAVVNDKYFNDLMPYINGNNLSLEKFKDNGVILSSNKENGALYKPKKENKIKIKIDKIDDVDVKWGRVKAEKIQKIDSKKTKESNLNLIGTIYNEVLLGPNHLFDEECLGLIISESTAKKINLEDIDNWNNRYHFEFNNDKDREENLEKMIKEFEESREEKSEGYIENTFKEIEKVKEEVDAVASLIYTILFFIMTITILSLINVRDINLNNRKKEFGIMFTLGMDKKMLRKNLMYEGFIQGVLAVGIGNILSLIIFNIIKNGEKKFEFSIGIMIIGSMIIAIIIVLNTLNAIKRLKTENPVEMIKNID